MNRSGCPHGCRVPPPSSLGRGSSFSFQPPAPRPDKLVCPPASALTVGLLEGGRGCVLIIVSAPAPVPVTTSVRAGAQNGLAGGKQGSLPGPGPKFSPRTTREPKLTHQRVGPKPECMGFSWEAGCRGHRDLVREWRDGRAQLW